MKYIQYLFVILLSCLFLILSGCGKITTQKTNVLTEGEKWYQSIASLSPAQQGKAAEKVLNSSNPSSVRDRALFIAASRPCNKGYSSRIELNKLYQAASPNRRSFYEKQYWNDLDGMDSNSLTSLTKKISAEQEVKFPWNVALLKAIRKGLIAHPEDTMLRLSMPGVFADPKALGISPASSDSIYIALVIPQSGTAAAMGRQIVLGAEAATADLQTKGKSVVLRVIDSNSSECSSQVKSLSSQFNIIGGALLSQHLPSLTKLSGGKALFAFNPKVPEKDEGVYVWKFASGPEDQINALMDFSDKNSLRSFGILTNGDRYSKGMSALFSKAAKNRGYSVYTSKYTPNVMKEWTQETKTFLEAGDCNAIFLPDKWQNIEMLISNLHYNGALDKVVLGTAIWEQALGENSRNNAAAHKKTFFPAVWNPKSDKESSRTFRENMMKSGGKIDDWAVLGYDFVEVAAAIRLPAQWSPAVLNARLANLSESIFAGAPILWDGHGKSHRKLFILRPAAMGAVPADFHDSFDVAESQQQSVPSFAKANPNSAVQGQSSTQNSSQVPYSQPKNLDDLVNSILTK